MKFIVNIEYGRMFKMVFKKSCVLYLVLVNSSILFYGCSKCVDKQVGEYNFTSEDLKINPYKGSEVLSFKNTSGDSLRFSVGDRITSTINVYLTTSDGDCKGNHTLVETDSTEISSSNQLRQFSIFMKFAPNPSASGGYYKGVLFSAKCLGQVKEGYSLSPVIFEQDTLTRYVYYWPNEDLLFYKSLNLGSKIFSDVYEIDLILQNATDGKWINKLYYNIKQGIVGFSIYPGETWCLY